MRMSVSSGLQLICVWRYLHGRSSITASAFLGVAVPLRSHTASVPLRSQQRDSIVWLSAEKRMHVISSSASCACKWERVQEVRELGCQADLSAVATVWEGDQGAEEALWVHAKRELFRQFWKLSPVRAALLSARRWIRTASARRWTLCAVSWLVSWLVVRCVHV